MWWIALTSEPLPVDLSGLRPEDCIRAGVIFGVAIVIAVGVQRLLVRVLQRGGSERLTAKLLGRLLGYAVVMVGLVYALGALDVRLAPLLGALGIGGVALALASQDVLANAVDGILLELRRPIRRGDQVGTSDFEGTVEDVNLRTVVLRTFDGQRVYVPNQTVLRNPIVNYTVRGIRRTTLEVGVAYATLLPRAKEVTLRTVAAVDGVCPSPAPEVWVCEFSEHAITIAVRCWHAPDNATLWQVRDAVAVALKSAYDEAGIEIAFPQRTLWLAGNGWPRAQSPQGGAVRRREG